MATLSGGAFQDIEGNPLAYGRLVMQLNYPATSGVIQVCPGKAITYQLDGNGNVVADQTIWSNDQLTPSGTFYYAKVYTKLGTLAWGPNCISLTQTGGVVNLSSWVPNNPE